MRQSLPLNDFEWMSKKELADFDPLKMCSNDSDKGYILEVTLDYPAELHMEHNAFPLAPEHMRIDEKMLSPYAMNALQELTKKKVYTANKLTSSFQRRENYVCHGLNLRFYLEKGLKLVKIHRGLKFTQEDFVRSHIDFFTRKRAQAKTKMEKDMYKLIINSLYGKFIENSSNRMDCRFVSSRKAALLRNTDPRTQSHMILAESLSIAFMKRSTVKLNQSWAVGFAILELSKLHMQQLFYDYIKPAFNNDVGVIQSDTDSWILLTPEPNADEAVKKLEAYGGIFDTSNYPDDHALRNDSKKNLTGYLKNEVPGKDILEVCAVRAKTYSIRTEDSLSNRCKGVKMSVRNTISIDDYRKCVSRQLAQHEITQHAIQSRSHQNLLVEQKRLAFSSFDDKRFLLCCGKHSVPYGSCLIQYCAATGKCYFCENPSILR